MRERRLLPIAAAAFIWVDCDEEPLDLGIDQGAGGTAGEAAMGGQMMPTGGQMMPTGGQMMPTGGQMMPMGGIDRIIDCDAAVGVYVADSASFSQSVAPHVATNCETCHRNRPFNFNSPADAPMGHQANIAAFLQYVDLANPADSEVLNHHGHAYVRLDSEPYLNVLRWIEARGTPPMGGG